MLKKACLKPDWRRHSMLVLSTQNASPFSFLSWLSDKSYLLLLIWMLAIYFMDYDCQNFRKRSDKFCNYKPQYHTQCHYPLIYVRKLRVLKGTRQSSWKLALESNCSPSMWATLPDLVYFLLYVHACVCVRCLLCVLHNRWFSWKMRFLIPDMVKIKPSPTNPPQYEANNTILDLWEHLAGKMMLSSLVASWRHMVEEKNRLSQSVLQFPYVSTGLVVHTLAHVDKHVCTHVHT